MNGITHLAWNFKKIEKKHVMYAHPPSVYVIAVPCQLTSVVSYSVQRYRLDCSCQTPLSMGFARQEYWSGLPGPPPGDLPNPGIKPASVKSTALTGRFFTTNETWEAPSLFNYT